MSVNINIKIYPKQGTLYPNEGLDIQYTGKDADKVTDDQKFKILGILVNHFDSIKKSFESRLNFSQTNPGKSIQRILPSCTFEIFNMPKKSITYQLERD